jgi:hypothetical protein
MRTLHLLAAASVLISCPIAQADPDALCDELTRFANASSAGSRTVELTTDWSIRPDPDDPTQLLWGTKSCKHDNLQASRDLCTYLLENTSTEFAEVNYRRVLRCLGAHIPESLAVDARLPRSRTSRKIFGVRLSSKLTVSFTPGSADRLPLLQISAEGAP